MAQNDLTRLKHIGPSRMKLLKDHGITTIDELHEMQEERLAAIKSIGTRYARQIKISAAEYNARADQRLLAPATALDAGRKEKLNQGLQAKLQQLHETLEGLNESLKPLGKKKYLVLYIDFKKKAAKLRVRLNEIEPSLKGQPKKVQKTILRKADSLSVLLNKAGQKRKKKRYRQVIRETQSFTRMLRDIRSSRESPSIGNGQGE